MFLGNSFQILKTPLPQVMSTFNISFIYRYSSNGLYLTTDDLLIFLETEQGVSFNLQDIYYSCSSSSNSSPLFLAYISRFILSFPIANLDSVSTRYFRITLLL